EHELKLAKVQEEVREILAEARRDAEHTKQEILATAQKEADASRQRAIADIERSRDQALTELFDFVSTNVVNATENVIGRSLSGDDHDRLVKEALSQINVRRN
ncbi:F0F1 ATP synthase subunit B family protein, partial [Schlesneria sp.]